MTVPLLVILAFILVSGVVGILGRGRGEMNLERWTVGGRRFGGGDRGCSVSDCTWVDGAGTGSQAGSNGRIRRPTVPADRADSQLINWPARCRPSRDP